MPRWCENAFGGLQGQPVACYAYRLTPSYTSGWYARCRGASARTRENTLLGSGYQRQPRRKRDFRACALQQLALGSPNQKGTPLHQAVTENGASQCERHTRGHLARSLAAAPAAPVPAQTFMIK